MEFGEREYQAMRLHIKGYRVNEIAERIGEDPIVVYDWFRNKEFKEELRKLRISDVGRVGPVS